ncbi:hypothetical protein EXIGLDRAFT_231471 [Exidia glandulosa HHB12029]|uniref:Uncharacterized protein n=1 Tax=Exidia glandulosa HHB12029 TaxID=1314781 RepID=A0A165E4T2_EXIGL|nr:hypothetical protein EXIGLDRAFT_231471 [Exidia glandulosa HHB12029]
MIPLTTLNLKGDHENDIAPVRWETRISSNGSFITCSCGENIACFTRIEKTNSWRRRYGPLILSSSCSTADRSVDISEDGRLMAVAGAAGGLGHVAVVGTACQWGVPISAYSETKTDLRVVISPDSTLVATLGRSKYDHSVSLRVREICQNADLARSVHFASSHLHDSSWTEFVDSETICWGNLHNQASALRVVRSTCHQGRTQLNLQRLDNFLPTTFGFDADAAGNGWLYYQSQTCPKKRRVCWIPHECRPNTPQTIRWSNNTVVMVSHKELVTVLRVRENIDI